MGEVVIGNDPFPAGPGERSIDVTMRRLAVGVDAGGGFQVDDVRELLEFVERNDERAGWLPADLHAGPRDAYDACARIWLARLPWIRLRWLIAGSALAIALTRLFS